MKALILASALPLLASLASAQDTPPPPPAQDVPAESLKKASPSAWLGIMMVESDGELIIQDVIDGSPAAKAGIKEGDRLLRIGDRAIEGDLPGTVAYVGKHKPGEVLEVRVQRGDKEETCAVTLAARPEEPQDDFRGEFHRKENRLEKALRDAVESPKKAKDRIKDEVDKLENQLRLKLHDRIKEPPPPARDLFHGSPEFHIAPDPDHPFAEPELRLPYGQNEIVPPQPRTRGYFLYKDKKVPANEDAIWDRVEQSVGRALKESGLPPETIGRAMDAVKDARKNGPELRARRAKLEAESARLEKEMQALQEKAARVRDELNKTRE